VTAVKLMRAGAAACAITLIISLALVPGHQGRALQGDPEPHRGPGSDVNMLITLAMVFGFVVIALWLWMGGGKRPGQELGADPVHGAVWPGDAGADQRQTHGIGASSQRGIHAARAGSQFGDRGLRRDSP
jgi:hypothetical protein